MKHRNVSLFVPHLGCPHNCIFCNQKTITGKCGELSTEEIIKACEIASEGNYDSSESEIAFFGGSFTAIDRSLMIKYLKTVQPYIDKYFTGIRISTRPDCINTEILEILQYYNVRSIELGAQSMDDRVLSLNERGHRSEDTVNASKLIKEYGFSLGLQMMTGLYGSTEETDRLTAEEFIVLRPDTVRIYPTVVLENTKLYDFYKKGLYTPPSLEQSVILCSHLLERFDVEGIKVIRLGLHSGGNVEDGFVAGVYHPAFGELCMSRVYRNRIERILPCPGDFTVAVPTGELSKVCGQKKTNKQYFESKGYHLSFIEDSSLNRYEVKLIK